MENTKQAKTNPILMDIPMPIVTPRLMLRNILPGDGAEIARAVGETWEQLNTWMLWADDRKTETDPMQKEIYARERHADFIRRTDFIMVGFERTTGRIVFFTGLHRPKWEIGQVEIGYWVRKNVQGKGYATESTNALIRYAFEALGMKRVVIGHAEGNEASRRVIEKLGFEREGIMRKGEGLPNGIIVDQYRYARLNTDGLPSLDVSWGKEP